MIIGCQRPNTHKTVLASHPHGLWLRLKRARFPKDSRATMIDRKELLGLLQFLSLRLQYYYRSSIGLLLLQYLHRITLRWIRNIEFQLTTTTIVATSF